MILVWLTSFKSTFACPDHIVRSNFNFPWISPLRKKSRNREKSTIFENLAKSLLDYISIIVINFLSKFGGEIFFFDKIMAIFVFLRYLHGRVLSENKQCLFSRVYRHSKIAQNMINRIWLKLKVKNLRALSVPKMHFKDTSR